MAGFEPDVKDDERARLPFNKQVRQSEEYFRASFASPGQNEHSGENQTRHPQRSSVDNHKVEQRFIGASAHMSRFYVSPDGIKGGKIYAGKEEGRHIAAVMRLKEGDKVTVFDGCGKEYTGTIESVRNKNVIINIDRIDTATSKRAVEISLAQALIKKDKLDYIVEKATELGVAEIIPVETGRAVVRPDEKTGSRKLERWQKIIIGAAKQCGRTDLPGIKKVSTFDEVLKIFPRYDTVLMPCLSEKTISLKDALSRIKNPKRLLLMIGPEGDFTPKEIERAEKNGAILISLGDIVLKSDTAAVAALAMLNYALL